MAQTILEEKVYCNATLDDTFSDNRVLVVLNKNSSNSDIEYNKETFSSYGCTVVKELTNMITTSIKTNSRNSLVNFGLITSCSIQKGTIKIRMRR